MMKTLAAALAGVALMSVPAFAQTNTPSSTAPASPNAAQSSSMNSGSSAMSTTNWMTSEQPGQWRAFKLSGLDVYNESNDKVGDIKELMMDSSGKVQAVVIGVGGFLGMGEHDVAVPWNDIKFVNEPVRSSTTTSSNTPAGSSSSSSTTGSATSGATTTRTTTSANRDFPDHALLNMTKDQLKAAPEFKFNK